MSSEMISRGKAKYLGAIKRIGGASAFRACGAKGGMAVAICLKGLKAALSEEDWANAWETAMK